MPAWANASAGYNGSATTREHTKILPDGLFTPGTHVEYFLRRTHLSMLSNFAMAPDTNIVIPQVSEGGADCQGSVVGSGSDDGHRWAEWSVLPDRWKDPAFGGSGMACMLFVDLNDSHGDERTWTTAAEMMGATASAKFGAHNGWHPASISVNPNATSGFVSSHGGQAGTRWDLYNVRGIDDPLDGFAGSIGSRLANRSSPGLLNNKFARLGPTPEMLRTYYHLVYMATGNSEGPLLGPLTDRSQDDISILQDFLSAAGATRGLHVQGEDFVNTETATGSPAHLSFLTNFLGVSLRGEYGALSLNNSGCLPLNTTSAIDNHGGALYSLQRGLGDGDDVLQPNVAVGAVTAANYENFGINGPYVASVFKPSSPTRPWIALTDGWDLKRLWTPYCMSEIGKVGYEYTTLTTAFAPLGCALTGPVGVVNDAQANDIPRLNYVRLLNNPTAHPAIEFGLVKGDRVNVRIYDLAGRIVRDFPEKPFLAGRHRVAWNGGDNEGRVLRAGIYFVQVRFREQPSLNARKLVIIR